MAQHLMIVCTEPEASPVEDRNFSAILFGSAARQRDSCEFPISLPALAEVVMSLSPAFMIFEVSVVT